MWESHPIGEGGRLDPFEELKERIVSAPAFRPTTVYCGVNPSECIASYSMTCLCYMCASQPGVLGICWGSRLCAGCAALDLRRRRAVCRPGRVGPFVMYAVPSGGHHNNMSRRGRWMLPAAKLLRPGMGRVWARHQVELWRKSQTNVQA